MCSHISVVIPVYNSADSLNELYQRLVYTLQNITNDFEIIMVDDYSRDNSYREIQQLNKKDTRVKGIKLSENFGQQNALICGFNFIKGDYVITLDDDLQQKPEDIIMLYNTIINGYEVVYGIPEEREYRFYRKIGAKMRNYFFSYITTRNPDIRVSSFRIMNRELVEKIISYQDAFVYISAIILQHTNKIGNITIKYENRKYGKSNYTFRKLLKLFINLYIYHGNIRVLSVFETGKPQYIIEDKIGF